MSLKYEQFAQRLKGLITTQRAATHVFVDDNEKTAYEADLLELENLSKLWDKVAQADAVENLQKATQDLDAFHKAKKFSTQQEYPSILGPASLDLATKYQALLVEAIPLEPTALFNSHHDNLWYTINNPIPNIIAEINRRNQEIADALEQLKTRYKPAKQPAAGSLPAIPSTSTAVSSATISSASSSASGNDKVTVEKNVDNPGGGDCAFYAFAIGLIDIAQKNPQFLEAWVNLSPEVIEFADEISQFDLSRDVRNEQNPGFELLFKLQSLLRKLVYDNRLDNLHHVCSSVNYRKLLEQDAVFLYFSELYYGANQDYDPRTNPFSSSKEIKQRIEALKARISGLKKEKQFSANEEEQLVAEEFIKLLYGDHVLKAQINLKTPFADESPVIKALESVLKKTWGTRDDLMVLGELFQFNMHVLINGKMPNYTIVDLPNQHTLTLNNLGNNHWMTKLQLVRLKKDIDAEEEAKKPTKKGPTAYTPKPKPQPSKAPDSTTNPAPEVKKTPPAATKKEPREEKISPENVQRLAELNAIIAQVSTEYIDHSEANYSFFHPHWEQGRERARFFAKSMGNSRDIRQANLFLIQYLENAENGNTWPHSFRTMLLQRLVQTAADTPSLQEVSEHFAEHLEQLKAKLENPSAAPTPTL